MYVCLPYTVILVSFVQLVYADTISTRQYHRTQYTQAKRTLCAYELRTGIIRRYCAHINLRLVLIHHVSTLHKYMYAVQSNDMIAHCDHIHTYYTLTVRQKTANLVVEYKYHIDRADERNSNSVTKTFLHFSRWAALGIHIIMHSPRFLSMVSFSIQFQLVEYHKTN